MGEKPKDRTSRKEKLNRATRKVDIGSENLYNRDTGEITQVPKIVVESGDVNFEKIWLWHLCDAYQLIGNKSVDVLNHLIETRNSENIVLGSQRKLADMCGVSIATFSRVMSVLKEHKIVTMPQQGVYRLSPEMIWKGGHQGRMQVLIEYKNEIAKQPPVTREQERKRLERELKDVVSQLDELKQKMLILSQAEESPVETAAAE